MDITSVSSYSELNEFVSYGYNRDGENLPQVNLLMVSGHSTHIPLFYRIIPGSIKDVSTMDESLARLGLIDVKRLHMVMDKGFYSIPGTGCRGAAQRGWDDILQTLLQRHGR